MPSYFLNLDFAVSVEIVAPTAALHPAQSQVTLVCLSTPNTTLNGGLSMQLTWTKDDGSLLQNNTRHSITRRSFTVHNVTSGRDVMYYETMLAMYSLKPSDNGMYSCSARVVLESSQRALTGWYTSRFNISVVGKWVSRWRHFGSNIINNGSMATDCG